MFYNSIRYWQTLTSVEAGSLGDQDPVVVLPLAAIEQHGPHLPLSTDLDIGLGLLDEAFRRLPADVVAYVLPPQVIGASREHLRFAGTLSLQPEVLVESILQLGTAVAAYGIRRLVVCNSHGGNHRVVDDAALQLREKEGLLVVKANYFAFTRPNDIGLPEAEWRHGLHGGAVETSMMLHLRPDLVRRDSVQRFTSLGQELDGTLQYLSPEGDASFAWLAGDLNPQGVTGDATLATADIGARIVTHYGSVLAAVIQDARAFPLERLV